MKYRLKLLCLVCALVLAACAPGVATPTPWSLLEPAPSASVPAQSPATATPAAPGPDVAIPVGETETALVERASADLALRLNLRAEAIEFVSVESVEWPDAGLGCPLAGFDYAQVITAGHRLELAAGGETYTYHANQDGQFLLCQDGAPELPVLPVKPGEIDDGIPWMPAGTPVDPEPVY